MNLTSVATILRPFGGTATAPAGAPDGIRLEDLGGTLLEGGGRVLPEGQPTTGGDVLLEGGGAVQLQDNDLVVVEGTPLAIQTFREALVAKLGAIPELLAVVDQAVFPGAIPEDHDLGRDGPALVYSIPSNPRGQVLMGSDGTSSARLRFEAHAYLLSAADRATIAVWNALDGEPGGWGNGTCQILSVTHQDEQDQHIPPRAGSDQWIYRIVSDYLVRYRTGFPTLS